MTLKPPNAEAIDDPSEVLDHLCRLVNKSLVVLERDSRGGTRYRLLETVRQYARHRLLHTEHAGQLHKRHFEFFFSQFRDSFMVLRREHQLPRLLKLREEQENIRLALEWAIASPDLAEEAIEFAGALFWFWTKRGLFEEGKLWLSRALQLQSSRRLRARALMGLAHMHYFQGRFDETASCTAEALSLSREENDGGIVCFALFFQSLVAFEYGHHDAAAARALEARAVATDELQHGGPLLVLANIALSRGDLRVRSSSMTVGRRASSGTCMISCYPLRACAPFVGISSGHVPTPLKPFQSAKSSTTHGDSLGASKCSPVSPPPAETPEAPRGCGEPRTRCWIA